MAPEERERVAAAEQHSFRDMSVFAEVVRHLRDDDSSERWLYLYSRPRKLEDQSVLWDGVAIDITERQQVADELERARDAAESATRAKSAFLATMSHEIRTPLSAIIGMSELLSATQLEPSQREFASTIEQSSRMLLMLINDILDFSTIEAGQFMLHHEPFQVPNLVQEISTLLESSARLKGLRFQTQIDPALPATLIGDDIRLRQVLLNLVSNAVKFTERGSVEVCATLERATPEAAWLRVEVTDTGIGLTPEASQRLFQPFVQADNSLARKYGGTGLGLAIARRLIELMDGQIGVKSELGQGSCFWFVVPLAVTSTPIVAPAPSVSPSVYRQISATPLILLAEDNPINQHVTSLQLKRLGYRVQAVASGTEVLATLAQSAEEFALILMDVQMPELDGYATTNQIRHNEAGTGQRIPIIAMNANALEGDRDRCLEVGMDDYLSKPSTIEGLRIMLNRWLAQDSSE
ncbi:MAG: ATP-binding protein [Oscillochloridaceae bacterium umkhey_bin13]